MDENPYRAPKAAPLFRRRRNRLLVRYCYLILLGVVAVSLGGLFVREMMTLLGPR
jgi:hypothetical protein